MSRSPSEFDSRQSASWNVREHTHRRGKETRRRSYSNDRSDSDSPKRKIKHAHHRHRHSHSPHRSRSKRRYERSSKSPSKSPSKPTDDIRSEMSKGKSPADMEEKRCILAYVYYSCITLFGLASLVPGPSPTY